MRWTLLFLSLLSLGIFGQGTPIHVDQFGYFPDAKKIAVLADPVWGFNESQSYNPSPLIEVREVGTDALLFSGPPEMWNNGEVDGLSGDRGWHFDFSELTIEGRYYLYDPANNIRSPEFNVSRQLYQDVLKASSKMFYYNRCGIEKKEPFAHSKWTDATSFGQDQQARYIYDQDNSETERDLSGGWFDAGDYNKYVTFNFTVIHNLLSAYEINPTLFADDWNIPESGNAVPDLIDELKWELDWMMKMANADGSVIIKMGSRNHSENASSPPSINKDGRFYGPTCTSASATLASNFAHASLVLSSFDPLKLYSDSLLDMAQKSFSYVLPYLENSTLETACDDGSIVAGDADQDVNFQIEALVTAAVYLYELTKDNAYQEFLKEWIPTLEPITSFWWGPYKLNLQDALLRYSSFPTADQEVVNLILEAAESAESNLDFFGQNELTLYNDFMPDWSYHWGSNNAKAGYGNLNLLMSSYDIGPDRESLEVKAYSMIQSFHGVNPLGAVYLTNMYEYGASLSMNEMYHAWFADGTKYDHALESEIGPPPGYLVGGPNKNFSVASISPPSNQPPSKSYLDFNTSWPSNSWEISEPAIYYQANYLRLLSTVMGLQKVSSSAVDNDLETEEHFRIVPNPAKDQITFAGNFSSPNVKVRIIDVTGKVVYHEKNVAYRTPIHIQYLNPGTYFLVVEDKKSIYRSKLVKW